jgi:nicotinate-nucleotide--dimethylbenzimidazole phosphoribosyltransferase
MPPAETLRRENVEVEAVLPVAEMQPPPVVTNPVAAAIVDEAYAERAREAVTEVVQPVVETRSDEGVAVPIVASEEPIQAVTAPEPIMETLEPVAFAPVAPVDADPLPERFYEPFITSVALPEPAALVAVEPPVPAPEEPVEVAAELVAPRIVESAPAALAQPVEAATEVTDDFEALLKQMDETLKMIKSVRSSAA